MASSSDRKRAQLPRLVEQTRVLLWLQFFLTLLSSLPIFIYLWILQGREDDAFRAGGFESPIYLAVSNRADLVAKLSISVLGIAVLLAFAAGSVRRARILLYPLVVLAQASVVVGLAYLIFDVVFVGAGVALVLMIGAQVLVNLFRGEVRMFSFGRRSDHAAAAVVAAPTERTEEADRHAQLSPAAQAMVERLTFTPEQWAESKANYDAEQERRAQELFGDRQRFAIPETPIDS